MARKPRRRPALTSCPQCGGEFRQGRPACPHCGSDAETGWRRESDLGEFTDEDYEEVVADLEDEEAAYASSPKWRRRRLVLLVVGLGIVALFVFWLLTVGSSGW